MEEDIVLCCPECHSRKIHIVITEKRFYVDKAVNGGIIGGIIDGHSLGLCALIGIESKDEGSWVECDVCKKVFKIE